MRRITQNPGVATGGARPWRDAVLVALLGLGLYGATLAPTVLWCDGGFLQLHAVIRRLEGSAGSHPWWVWIAHQFTKIPWGDIAGRVNLVSAIFGAATLACLYLILRELDLSREASFLATLALAVSHTFWSHSVCAEVYTLALATMALLVWTGLRWYRSGRRVYLIGAGLALGLGLGVHLMVALYLPALLWLAWRGRDRLDAKGILGFALAWGVGVLPLVALLLRDARALGLDARGTIHWAVSSSSGYDFGGQLFDYSVRLLPSDALEWLAFLGMQFVGLAGICGIIGAIKVWRMSGHDLALFLLFLYLGTMAFAFAYRVGDRYVFYLPSYLPFAGWIGLGFDWLMERLNLRKLSAGGRFWRYAGLAALVVALPILTYRLAPYAVARGITFRDSRHVPGARGGDFFLWPPKARYYDPRTYAEATLAAAPEHALLLADPILAAPIQFLQAVEGVRPDVTLRYCCWDIEVALSEAEGRPIALADLAPEVYPVDWLRANYEVERRGVIYVLSKRPP